MMRMLSKQIRYLPLQKKFKLLLQPRIVTSTSALTEQQDSNSKPAVPIIQKVEPQLQNKEQEQYRHRIRHTSKYDNLIDAGICLLYISAIGATLTVIVRYS